SATFSLRGANTAAMLTALHAQLLSAIESPPYVIRLALPAAAAYSYLDVVKVEHDIPADPILFLNKALIGITIAFECAPFLRGDRQILSNLAINPGFEAPTGGTGAAAASPPVGFSDSMANVNAYTVVSGSAPTTGPANAYTDIVNANGGAN